MSDINCPYCDAENDIDLSDGGYEQDTLHETSCGDCDKNFTFNTSIIYHHESFKAPCLNGEPHSFKPTHTSPKFFTKMECEHCEQRRELTPEERIKFNIPSKLDL